MGDDDEDRDIQPDHERGDPASDEQSSPTPDEAQDEEVAGRLDWLRAGVLGANDGIVATSALILGVAASTTSREAILTAGIAGLVAGAGAMAAAEYVSVSSQRDSEKAVLAKRQRELKEHPEQALAELTDLYTDKGLSHGLAEQVAHELTEHDALGAHAEAGLGLDPDNPSGPWTSAFASFAAFTVGSMVPLLGIAVPPTAWRELVVVLASVLALASTGILAARLGRSPTAKALWRNVSTGLLAMSVTYGIGSLVGHAG